MKLNVFFSNNEERLGFIKEQFKLEEIIIEENKIITPIIKEIAYLKLKGSFKGIPGFWLELQFNKLPYSKELYNKIISIIIFYVQTLQNYTSIDNLDFSARRADNNNHSYYWLSLHLMLLY